MKTGTECTVSTTDSTRQPLGGGQHMHRHLRCMCAADDVILHGHHHVVPGDCNVIVLRNRVVFEILESQ